MATSKAISIELKPEQHAILERQLESGHYGNASEVLQDALIALDQRDSVYTKFLRAKVQASMANKKPSIPADIVFERLEARHHRRMKIDKRDA